MTHYSYVLVGVFVMDVIIKTLHTNMLIKNKKIITLTCKTQAAKFKESLIRYLISLWLMSKET